MGWALLWLLVFCAVLCLVALVFGQALQGLLNVFGSGHSVTSLDSRMRGIKTLDSGSPALEERNRAQVRRLLQQGQQFLQRKDFDYGITAGLPGVLKLLYKQLKQIEKFADKNGLALANRTLSARKTRKLAELNQLAFCLAYRINERLTGMINYLDANKNP